jgi:hypothetical protein
MTAPDWQTLYIAENAARKAAEARLRAMHAVMWLALAGVLTIAALCGTLHAAEAASHAVARHHARQEMSR